MTKIKLCGLKRLEDIETANFLMPDYVGFVFTPKSKRFVPYEVARELKRHLHPAIRSVGVFADQEPEQIAESVGQGIIDLVQLHGKETEEDLRRLRLLTDAPLIRAFRVAEKANLEAAESSSADYILLDSGGGTGKPFDWNLLQGFGRPYFLAGGLNADNIGTALRTLSPYAVDVSSGIETDGRKDPVKMAALTAAVRKEENK